MFSKSKTKNAQSGFSLIEVLISSLIIGIVTAIVVIKYSGFNNSVLLKNQAYEVALAVRQAQVFSISSRSNTGTFYNPYGVYIDLSSGPAQEVLFFIDASPYDGEYDPNDDTLVDTFTVDSRFAITDFSADTGGVVHTSGTYDELSITFARPDFDADIDLHGSASTYISAIIELSTETGSNSRQISVYSTGQISVQ